MKITAVAFLCSTSLLSAQVGAPPAPTRGGTDTPKGASAVVADTQSLINSLSPSELQAAIGDLKTNYFKPGLLAESEIQRAMLVGLLARLAPGASLRYSGTNATNPSDSLSPFKAETLQPPGRSIAYLRVGSLTKANLESLDSALKTAAQQSIPSVILDLRATPESNDFDIAAEVLSRFCPKGTALFSIRKAAGKAGSEHSWVSQQDPSFKGPIMVLIDQENAGASEVIAATLRLRAKAILIGAKTKGEGVEFADFKLGSDKVLRIAVAEIVVPGGPVIYGEGVNPDIPVEVAPELQRQILAKGLEEGVAGLVFETERPRMNEASLVAGTNPEMDAYQSAQKAAAEKKEPAVHDPVLQRAVDLITTIGIFDTPK